MKRIKCVVLSVSFLMTGSALVGATRQTIIDDYAAQGSAGSAFGQETERGQRAAWKSTSSSGSHQSRSTRAMQTRPAHTQIVPIDRSRK